MPQNRVPRPVVLGIVGDSATGKTTLSAGIAEILGAGGSPCSLPTTITSTCGKNARERHLDPSTSSG